jgi:hypothetical protein
MGKAFGMNEILSMKNENHSKAKLHKYWIQKAFLVERTDKWRIVSTYMEMNQERGYQCIQGFQMDKVRVNPGSKASKWRIQ